MLICTLPGVSATKNDAVFCEKSWVVLPLTSTFCQIISKGLGAYVESRYAELSVLIEIDLEQFLNQKKSNLVINILVLSSYLTLQFGTEHCPIRFDQFLFDLV